jgi:hypothetical protein
MFLGDQEDVLFLIGFSQLRGDRLEVFGEF